MVVWKYSTHTVTAYFITILIYAYMVHCFLLKVVKPVENDMLNHA